MVIQTIQARYVLWEDLIELLEKLFPDNYGAKVQRKLVSFAFGARRLRDADCL
jgi:hypothetical protein